MSEASAELRTAFLQAFRRRGDTVTVVTYRDDGGVVSGMTATSTTSVSADPPMLLVCVNRGARTHAAIEHAGVFGVSILAEGQEAVSNHCAMPGSDKVLTEDQLVDPDSDAPGLAGAVATMRCVVAATHHHGTHSVFIGEVTAVEWDDSLRPLIYHDGSYTTLAPS